MSFEVRVTRHDFETMIHKNNRFLMIVKMFRMVTGEGLKDSAIAVEKMTGTRMTWDKDNHTNGHRVMFNERLPVIWYCKSRVHAAQVRIEFTNGGFTAEVIETDGQGSKAS